MTRANLAIISAISPWPAKRSRRSGITLCVAPPEPVVFHTIVMPAHYRNVLVESIALGRNQLLIVGDDPVPAEVFSSESIMGGLASGMIIHPVACPLRRRTRSSASASAGRGAERCASRSSDRAESVDASVYSSRSSKLRRPRVVGLERRIIQTHAGRVEIERWYVTLRFGSVVERLAVSARTARWIKQEEKR